MDGYLYALKFSDNLEGRSNSLAPVTLRHLYNITVYRFYDILDHKDFANYVVTYPFLNVCCHTRPIESGTHGNACFDNASVSSHGGCMKLLEEVPGLFFGPYGPSFG